MKPVDRPFAPSRVRMRGLERDVCRAVYDEGFRGVDLKGRWPPRGYQRGVRALAIIGSYGKEISSAHEHAGVVEHRCRRMEGLPRKRGRFSGSGDPRFECSVKLDGKRGNRRLMRLSTAARQFSFTRPA